MKYLLISLITLLCACTTSNIIEGPFFQDGEDPNSSDSQWVLLEEMSDEFDGNAVDEEKWQITGQGWKGRSPGLFVADNITVEDGSLQILSTVLEKPVMLGKKEYTHGGGYVGSRKGMTYGYYECEMRANKTFMSSTFWLINEGKNQTGCDKRTTELDIQECVGQIVSDKGWCKNFNQTMNSNTHSRNVPKGCDYKTATQGANADVNGKVYDGFHVYGVWWKSKDEVLFFLDGKFHSKVTPPADFDIDMHLRMVVETYDWNPMPADGGMTGSVADRTTTYNWVRSWQLLKE